MSLAVLRAKECNKVPRCLKETCFTVGEQSFWDCFHIGCGNLWSQPLRIFSHLFCFLLNYQEVKLEGKACANIEADLVGVAHDMLLKFKGAC